MNVGRLKAIEKRLDASGSCGDGCPPIHRTYSGWLKDLPGEESPPAPCPRCGRPPVILEHVSDPDFYTRSESVP